MATGRITLRDVQAVAFYLEHGRWPDPQTAAWFERRASGIALEFLALARVHGSVAASALLTEPEAAAGEVTPAGEVTARRPR
jgi:hypothetical protein